MKSRSASLFVMIGFVFLAIGLVVVFRSHQAYERSGQAVEMDLAQKKKVKGGLGGTGTRLPEQNGPSERSREEVNSVPLPSDKSIDDSFLGDGKTIDQETAAPGYTVTHTVEKGMIVRSVTWSNGSIEIEEFIVDEVLRERDAKNADACRNAIEFRPECFSLPPIQPKE